MPIGPEYQEPEEPLPVALYGTLVGHEGPVLAARFNHNGQYCLTCGKDRTVRLWNPARELCLKTYQGHGQPVFDVTTSRDNSRIASVGGDKQVFYWDVATGRTIRRYRGHDSEVNSITFAASDTVLVTGGYDQTVRVWDCRSNSFDAIQRLEGFKDSVTAVVVSNFSIIAGSVDGTIHHHDIRAGRITIDDVHHPVTSVHLSNDSNCVLAGCLAAPLCLLDRASGEELASYSGHVNSSAKLDCVFTNTDAYVAGSSEDGGVLFWDLVDGNIVHRQQAHDKVVCGLDYHPTDVGLLTCSVDGTAKVWTTQGGSK
mmetsp:Transcript_14229/g.27306  ORF Transcript_14229/g.27306 Transcript_14229/m.27306 type:complete len:313 (-) Transcript_14229:1216-2154(-)